MTWITFLSIFLFHSLFFNVYFYVDWRSIMCPTPRNYRSESAINQQPYHTVSDHVSHCRSFDNRIVWSALSVSDWRHPVFVSWSKYLDTLDLFFPILLLSFILIVSILFTYSPSYWALCVAPTSVSPGLPRKLLTFTLFAFFDSTTFNLQPLRLWSC